MDESWQIKCSSTLQSLVSSMASSSSSPELQNQTERKAGSYAYAHDLRRKDLGAVHTLPGNSFLALLSGPPSLLQSDFKELLNSRLLNDSNSVVVTPQALNGIPSEYLSEQNLQRGTDFLSTISSRSLAGSNGCTNSVLPGLQTPISETTINHRLVSGNVKPKCSFSVSEEWRATIPSNPSKVSNIKVQTSEMKCVDENSSISDHTSSFLSNCPRVFCLGTVGYLLISNTGLLGIICSCHNLQMSVLKFCEHSGLCGGNAGEFVRMESGETIAMWRKLYFLKFGIRISEDRSDWDWPEGLTATSGLGVKSRTSFPNSYNISHLAHSSEGILRPGQVSDSAMLSNHHTHRNSVTCDSQNKQKRNTRDGKNVSVEGLIGTSQRNMHILANTHIVEHPFSGFSTVSKSLSSGPQDDYRSTIYTDAILKNGDSCIVRPAVQDLRTNVQKPDFSMSKSAPNGVFIGGDAAFSNIELKLGQPHQSSQNSKASDRPVLGTRLLDTFVNPSKLLVTQQMLHNTSGSCSRGFEVGQSLSCAADPCNFNNKSEQSQLNPGNCGFQFNNVNIAATPTVDKSRGNLDHNTVVSLLSNFNLLTGSSVQINPTNNMLSSTKQTVPLPQHCEPRFTACDSSYGPWNYGNGIERRLIETEMCPYGPTDQSKGVKAAAYGPYFMKGSGSRSHTETEASTSHPFSSAAQGSNCTLHPLSSALPETSDAKRLPSNHVNIPSFENNLLADHVTHRLLTSNFGSRQILPQQVIKKGLPLASSACLPDQTPALHREEGIGYRPHLLDDDSRMLALRQIMGLSKQQYTFSSVGMNRREGRCDGFAHFHHSVAESLAPGDQYNGHCIAGNREASEAAVKAYLAGATYTNGCCDLSTLIRGISIHSKEIEVHGQFSGDPPQKEQLSTSQSQKDIPGPTAHEKDCRVSSACIHHSCNCSVYINCSERNLETKGGSFPYAVKEQEGKVNGDSSSKFSSKFPQNRFDPNCKIPSKEQEAISSRNLPKNIVGHASQWRDVPSKVKGFSKDISRDASAKCIHSPEQIMHKCKEHPNSNVSSTSSAPAVTQLSVVISTMDSSRADAGNTGCVSNLVVDEGSAIDKCWSSDDEYESERSAEFHQDMCKASSNDSGSSLNANHQSSRSLLDELKLINSLTWKKGQKQIRMEMPVPKKDNLSSKYHKCLKMERQKKVCSSLVHCEKYEEINSADSTSSASESIEMISLPKPNGSEHRRPVSLSMRKPIRKKDLCKLYNDREDEDELKASSNNCKIPEAAAGKKFKRDCAGELEQSPSGGQTHGGSKIMKKRTLEGCFKSSFSSLMNSYSGRPRPVACGKYGELSAGGFGADMVKSSKIVPLRRVLKSAKRCELDTNGKRIRSSPRKLKQADIDGIQESYDELHHLKTGEGNRSKDAEVYGKANSETSLGNCELAGNLPVSEVERRHQKKKDCGEEDSITNARLKSKTKEIRKRSVYELTVDDNGICSTSKGPHHKKYSVSEMAKCFPEMTKSDILRSGDDRKHELCKGDDEKSPQEKTLSSLLDLDSFCCVCGGSNKDEVNYLLQCNTCLIRVHQACYGVSKVPKDHWYCRPCRSSSRNIVCVLCGYGGGAMTQALRSRAIVKSLLRAWNFETEGKPKNVLLPVKPLDKSLSGWDCSDSGIEDGSAFAVLQPENTEPLASAVGKTDFPYHPYVSQNDPCVTNMKVDNSITAGLLNSTTKQWVHMVCGLWTSGTRCPNVDTMSAFDVSGALRPKADEVCSICSRPGGTCIKCRILKCSVHFHPWCAHQKGLLQSEVEGVENENVGFYGRCLLHATNPMRESDPAPTDRVTGGLWTDKLTCARTEGYKGRKRDGFFHNYYNHSKGKVGCYVPQEQINAWTHINRQKYGIQGLPKLPVSDVDHDCRKEYARYKQGQLWKHLVVYKSGIHALGLYTSRFISRGEMVVEYVGEIVGLRVSDKRENEYQSGRKLQCKSACYFFRIDKEHIIDATRKGGIARFVNHSCLPNCVAKVISMRNDKKVVFFAERDIFPGEEITYDYHFNHEDEGKKIPCFCNSKNCRRYLN